MAFTRKFLKALGLEDEKIETIMEEHTAVTDGLKKERDGYKADAEKLPEVQKQLDEQQKNSDGKDYKKLYEQLQEKTAAEKAHAGKASAYKALLKSAGVSEKFISLIAKANSADIDSLELGDDGKAKDAENLVEAMKKDLADYIGTTTTNGTTVSTPPKGEPVKKTRGEIMAIKDTTERQKAIAENMELFQ